MVSTWSMIHNETQSVTEELGNSLGEMDLLLELQEEFTKIKMWNVEGIDAFKEKNARMKRKLVETKHEKKSP